jgi:hypothetical protein
VFPQLEREGETPLFPPLAHDRNQQIVKIRVFRLQGERLVYAKTGIQQRKYQPVKTKREEARGLVCDELTNLNIRV